MTTIKQLKYWNFVILGWVGRIGTLTPAPPQNYKIGSYLISPINTNTSIDVYKYTSVQVYSYQFNAVTSTIRMFILMLCDDLPESFDSLP